MKIQTPLISKKSTFWIVDFLIFGTDTPFVFFPFFQTFLVWMALLTPLIHCNRSLLLLILYLCLHRWKWFTSNNVGWVNPQQRTEVKIKYRIMIICGISVPHFIWLDLIGQVVHIQVHHCARESSMSMLMEFSRAFVLMKASWACSWSSHAHVRVEVSRARPL